MLNDARALVGNNTAWRVTDGAARYDTSTFEAIENMTLDRIMPRWRSLNFYRRFRSLPKQQLDTAKTSSPARGAWLDFAAQAVIFMGPIGAMLLGSGSRWGFVIGLATQPFWFYTSFRHRQWGIFIASVFYAFGWAMGVCRNF
jgi:hypothetical protein